MSTNEASAEYTGETHDDTEFNDDITHIAHPLHWQHIEALEIQVEEHRSKLLALVLFYQIEGQIVCAIGPYGPAICQRCNSVSRLMDPLCEQMQIDADHELHNTNMRALTIPESDVCLLGCFATGWLPPNFVTVDDFAKQDFMKSIPFSDFNNFVTMCTSDKPFQISPQQPTCTGFKTLRELEGCVQDKIPYPNCPYFPTLEAIRAAKHQVITLSEPRSKRPMTETERVAVERLLILQQSEGDGIDLRFHANPHAVIALLKREAAPEDEIDPDTLATAVEEAAGSVLERRRSSDTKRRAFNLGELWNSVICDPLLYVCMYEGKKERGYTKTAFFNWINAIAKKTDVVLGNQLGDWVQEKMYDAGTYKCIDVTCAKKWKLQDFANLIHKSCASLGYKAFLRYADGESDEGWKVLDAS